MGELLELVVDQDGRLYDSISNCYKACNGCSFYFLASLIKHFQAKTVIAGNHLKLSQPMLLKCFLIFAHLQPHVSHRIVSYKKHVAQQRNHRKVIYNYCTI